MEQYNESRMNIRVAHIKISYVCVYVGKIRLRFVARTKRSDRIKCLAKNRLITFFSLGQKDELEVYVRTSLLKIRYT